MATDFDPRFSLADLVGMMDDAGGQPQDTTLDSIECFERFGIG